jgi:hypothetical protein
MNFRILEKDEIIRETDQYYDDAKHEWVATICAGQKAPDPAYTAHRIYRRAI